MYLKGIKRGDISDILECIYWNKYHFRQKQSSDCMDKEGTLKRMTDLENRLKEAIK